VEDAGNLSACLVLHHVQNMDEALLPIPPGKPHLGPICQYGNQEGGEQDPPMYEGEPLNGVAQDSKGADGAADPHGHCGNVEGPGKAGGEEDPKVSQGVGRDHTNGGLNPICECDQPGSRPEMTGRAGGVEEHDLRFVQVSLKAELAEPCEDCGPCTGHFGSCPSEGCTRGEDGAVIDVEGQVSVHPCLG
jgi:hypothetical protein